MRFTALLLAITVAFAVPNKTASMNTKPERLSPNVVKIAKVITHLQPAFGANEAKAVAKIIDRRSAETGIDWRLVVAILFQESSLRLDPQNCKVNFTRCNDMGIGQVRFSVWGKELKIDKKRMVTDADYAIGKVYKILAHYKIQYSKKELNWFTRYHSGDPDFRSAYMRKLNKAYAKINAVKD